MEIQKDIIIKDNNVAFQMLDLSCYKAKVIFWDTNVNL